MFSDTQDSQFPTTEKYRAEVENPDLGGLNTA